jgi:hypothetical protein
MCAALVLCRQLHYFDNNIDMDNAKPEWYLAMMPPHQRGRVRLRGHAPMHPPPPAPCSVRAVQGIAWAPGPAAFLQTRVGGLMLP